MINRIREDFLLDPNIIFLNHGSYGACPKQVFQAYQNWQLRLEKQPVLFLGRELVNFDMEARQVLADFLNTDESNLAFIPNATHGVNIVARSLQLKSGDEVLTTDHEYGACDYTWDFICTKTGAKYIHQPIALPIESPEDIIEEFWRGITPRTKVIFMSHITSPTALHFPVEAICQRAGELGILSIVDGAHAPGQLDIDLPAIGADFFTGNCHKWLMAPKGAGFLYVRPECQDLIEPLIVSWGYKNDLTHSRSKFLDYLVWSGTDDPAAYLAVPDAIQYQESHDWRGIRMSCHEILGQAIEQICTLSGLGNPYGNNSTLYHQMGIAPLPHIRDLNALKACLYDDYHIEVPLIEWNQQHFIRISVQGYNSQDDIVALIQALEKLLPEYSD